MRCALLPLVCLLPLAALAQDAAPLFVGPPAPARPARPAAAAPAISTSPGPVRIKDVADVLGVRDNQLVGQGLVVGLDGTGDKQGILTSQFLANVVSRLGVTVSASALKPKNVAIVAVTAQLPPFTKKGAKLDVQVSSLGDASSLQGGVLLQTPLQGGDGRVYAVAQGAISVGGFTAAGGGGGDSTITKNHTLVGRVPNGALVEREVPTAFEKAGVVRLILRKGDFTTAERMATCINERWPGSSKAIDPCTVEFLLPKTDDIPFATLAELERLEFMPDNRARVVINERTGTIVAGAQVRLLPTVLSHGSLMVMVKRTPVIVQPAPFSNGQTVVTEDTTTTAIEEERRTMVLEHGPTLADLAAALNALKVKPRDIIAIFQALKEAGALNAELIIM